MDRDYNVLFHGNKDLLTTFNDCVINHDLLLTYRTAISVLTVTIANRFLTNLALTECQTFFESYLLWVKKNHELDPTPYIPPNTLFRFSASPFFVF